MADRIDPSTRRRIMQSVRRSRTGPEQVFAGLLRAARIRFRQNVPDLPGRPDFLLLDSSVAIFVHGCFWHGHSACEKGRRRPVTNKAFWTERLRQNQRRDKRVAVKLRRLGVSVIVV
ncbi:MAG: DNA mismatch endonuclease Vsr [Phycisphaerales bacterium]|nr:DNA mismatch endonuclease Vsr [Phycisphaerales bacterium]